MLDINKKVIFTHPEKCGGTTVEALFGWHPKFSLDKSLEYRRSFQLWKHASLDLHIIEAKANNIDIKDTFVFSCVRNPWDRAVSLYHHRKFGVPRSFERRNPGVPLPERLAVYAGMDFDAFVEREYAKFKKTGSTQLAVTPFVTSGEGRSPDYIIRYEDYQEGLDHVAGLYGLDSAGVEPLNVGVRPLKDDYKSYYTKDDLISKVGELSKDSVDMFGYSFGQPTSETPFEEE
jgi:hypothetical protein